MPTFNYSIFVMMKNVTNDSVIKWLCHELNHKSNINYQLQTVTNIISAIKTKRKLLNKEEEEG